MTPTQSDEFFDAHLAPAPVMVILRGLAPAAALDAARVAWAAGVRLVEVPLQRPRDVDSIALLGAHAPAGALVGSGTITDEDLVAASAAAGARFTVAPGLDAGVVAASLAAGMAHLPGVATPSEIQQAGRLGLTWVKAFPASALGAGWFAAVRAPFPGVRLVATGGVDVHNGGAFRAAGAAALSLGSAFAGAGVEAVRALIES